MFMNSPTHAAIRFSHTRQWCSSRGFQLQVLTVSHGLIVKMACLNYISSDGHFIILLCSGEIKVESGGLKMR